MIRYPHACTSRSFPWLFGPNWLELGTEAFREKWVSCRGCLEINSCRPGLSRCTVHIRLGESPVVHATPVLAQGTLTQTCPSFISFCQCPGERDVSSGILDTRTVLSLLHYCNVHIVSCSRPPVTGRTCGHESFVRMLGGIVVSKLHHSFPGRVDVTLPRRSSMSL